MENTHNCSKDDMLILLGQRLTYQSQSCEIIELLDNCKLVLQVLEDETNSIQATQYGEGHRAVPSTYIVPIFDGEGNFQLAELAEMMKKTSDK